MTTATSNLHPNGRQSAPVFYFPLTFLLAAVLFAIFVIKTNLTEENLTMSTLPEGEITVVVDSDHAELYHQADALQALSCFQHHGAQKQAIERLKNEADAHHLICAFPEDPETIFDVIVEKHADGYWRLKSAYQKEKFNSALDYYRRLMGNHAHSSAGPWFGNVIYEFRIPNTPFLP
jgi:hypothetical protein